MLLEIVGAGGVLQGDHGELLTPGFPSQNNENGVLYQVLLMINMTSTPFLDLSQSVIFQFALWSLYLSFSTYDTIALNTVLNIGCLTHA